MRLVIFGLSVSSAWGNGHATLWRGLFRALARQGHHVTFFELDAPYYAPHRDYHAIPGGELILYTDWAEALPRARRCLAGADVGMVTSYCPDGIAATELLAESSVPVRAFYDLDAGVTLQRLAEGLPVEYVGERGLRDFDLVLSYTGGPTLRGLREALGARRTVPLYGSVDPHLHAPTPPADRYQADVSYLGTYAEDRQGVLEALFVEPARRLPERKFLIGGAQYPASFPWTKNIYFVRHVPPQEHPAFYCSSRLTVNATRAGMARVGWCPSGRLFEAAACGVPVLSDWFGGLDEFFTPGREILVARTTEETEAAMSLSDRELRRIGEAARERALTEHTAERRAEEMVRHLASARVEEPAAVNQEA